MFTNYLKLAFRNLRRHKGYSLINLTGLAIGITCCLLLSLHIKEDLGYEKSYSKHDRIFRVVTTEWSKSHPPLAGEMKKFFPEINATARFAGGQTDVANTESGNKAEIRGFAADSSAIDMFDMKAVAGDPTHALAEPFAVVLTRSSAEKLFGKQNPLGQKLIFGHNEEWVRAVIEDQPANSHLQFDYLLSMPTFYKFVPESMTSSRHWMFGWTYIQFDNKADMQRAEKRTKDFWTTYWQEVTDKKVVADEAAKLRFQPLTAIHLHSDLIQEMGPNGNVIYIYIFIAVEILILLIACINFVNLFTTQALKRLKEVAIRKVLGAHRGQLIIQFLGEAFILTILAGALAILLYESALPFYNNLTGKHITPSEILQPANLVVVFVIVLATGLLSGLFPALFISRFEPASSLKGSKIPGSGANLLRKALVIFQFVAASFLIISTILVYRQMNLFRNHELGFDKDQVMVVKLYGGLREKLHLHPELLKNELLSNPDILAVGKSSNLIGDDLSVESVTPVDADPAKNYPTVRVFRVDDNYLTVMGIRLEEGRNFSREFNDSNSFIMNETAAAALGLNKPLGALVINNSDNNGGMKGKVVGVVKDFHFVSLHNQIEPLVLEYSPGSTQNLLIKIKAGNTEASIAFVRNKIQKIMPDNLFSYGFLDEKIAGLYRKEDNMSKILKVFSALSILISCLGLFGLAAHASQIRTKEIGIRKVIGAGMVNLIQLLSREFLALVMIGNLIAWPLAWWAINSWLQEFTYKVTIGWPVFLVSAILTLCIAVLTISYHCIRTARMNPAKSIRTE